MGVVHTGFSYVRKATCETPSEPGLILEHLLEPEKNPDVNNTSIKRSWKQAIHGYPQN